MLNKDKYYDYNNSFQQADINTLENHVRPILEENNKLKKGYMLILNIIDIGDMITDKSKLEMIERLIGELNKEEKLC